jgi:regulator of sigma E protease|tara:strand:+ start:3322 stop:4446 length:1125 start_codon:yes stop_codon:yes gene_type:complete
MDIIQTIIQYLPIAIQYFLAFALLITVVVFIHELGHYSVGRWCGIGVETFSIGMGKQIWGKRDKSGTLWRVAILPIGGYVKFYGDEDPSGKKLEVSDNIDSDKNFHNKSVWKKIATTAAGPLFNFILAIFIFSIIFFFRGESLVQPYVGQVVDESPAYNAGLKTGDEIIYADGNEILYFNDLRNYVLENPSSEIELTIIRDGLEETVFLTPEVISSKDRFGNEYSSARIGVIGSQNPEHVELRKYGFISSLFRGTKETYNLSAKILNYLGNLIVGRESIDQMGGPIKIIQISGEISNYGIIPLLALIAAISVNLGIINLLPIPVLDGGHLLYYSFEVLRGKPLSQKTQEVGMQIGMSLLIALMIFVTFLDISRL